MQGSFREDEDALAGVKGPGEPPRMGDASGDVEAVDVEGAEPVEEPAREEVVPKLRLRDEVDGAREGRGQHEAIEVARVVRGHDEGPVPGEVLGSLDGQPDADEPEDGAADGPRAGEAEARPADGDRGEGRNRPHQRERPPHPSRVGDLAEPARRPSKGGPGAARREAHEPQPERS